MRLTFLLLSPTFGMHQYTADLANRMMTEHEVSLLTTGNYPADRYGPDVAVYTPVRLTDTGLSSESLRIGQLQKVKQALQLVNPDVVHITGPHFWNIALVHWLRRQGIPVVHTIHDLDPHHGTSYGRLLHLWNWAIIRWADHIVVHGERYRRRLMANGASEARLTCTPLTHLFLSYVAWRELKSGEVPVSYEPMVLFFGRLEAYKGLGTLLRSFEQLRKTLTEAGGEQRARLILAGPGQQRQWRQNGRDVEWRNHLIGDEEGLELFRRCAVVVLPYQDATQSALIAAAYYFQKPVIVTDVGALSEYVIPGKTGFVVEHQHAEAGLVEAMTRILRSPAHSKSLGSAGRAWYDEQRAIETQSYKRLYQRLIS